MGGLRQAASSARLPLPPPDLPLRDSFAELKRRADGGDANAACRLAAELDRCDRLREEVRNLDTLMKVFATGAQSGGIFGTRDRAVERRTLMVRTLAHCDGAPRLEPRQVVHYWRMAALGGHLPSLTHYATGDAFGPRPSLDLLGELQVYRSEAGKLARRAAAAGDPMALLSLARAYSPIGKAASGEWTYLDQAVEPDVVQSLALFRLAHLAYAGDEHMESTLARNIGRIEGTMTGSQRLQADRLLQRLQREWQSPDIGQSLSGMQTYVLRPPATALENCALEARPLRPTATDPPTMPARNQATQASPRGD